jgi:hypothetical protein
MLGFLLVEGLSGPSGTTIPGPIDLRGGRALTAVDDCGGTKLWRRVLWAGGGGGAMDAAAPLTSVRLAVFAVRYSRSRSRCGGWTDISPRAFGLDPAALPELGFPPRPGTGKWLKLGSPDVRLLWKSSKLICGRKSAASGGVCLSSLPEPKEDVPKVDVDAFEEGLLDLPVCSLSRVAFPVVLKHQHISALLLVYGTFWTSTLQSRCLSGWSRWHCVLEWTISFRGCRWSGNRWHCA